MLIERAAQAADFVAEQPKHGRRESGQSSLAASISTFTLFRNREFMAFWGGQAISQTGTWMQQFAQSWVVTTLASSALALASVNFAASIPALVLMPLGGVIADRLDRRRILLVTQWGMAVLAVVLGILLHAGHLRLWHIWIIALLLGLATAFDLPAYQSFYPQLVQREDLSQAIALNQVTFHASRIIGPALASWVVAVWGISAAFFVNGTSFLAVIDSLLLIKPRAATGADSTRTWQFMADGVRYVRERRDMIGLFGVAAITTMFIFPNITILMPYYAKHVLHTGPGGLGAIMAAAGAGAFLGATCLLALPRRARIGSMMTALAVIAAALCALAWSRQLGPAIAATAVVSFGISSSLGIASTIVQESVPNVLRGRVMSLYSIAFTGVMPFASVALARVADKIGMCRELLIAGALYCICGILLSRMLRIAPGDTNLAAHTD